MILALCDACDRQYDVSTLEPGTPVRCACDRVFAVPARSPVAVEALVCSNCRGVVGEEDAGCPWCGAGLEALRRRATTVCPKCFARMPEDARHCSGCGVTIAPQALQPLPVGRECPRCGGSLRHRALEQASVIECSVCEGMWLTPDVFARARSQAARDPAFGTGGEEARPGGLEPVRYLPCLACGELMNRRLFRHGSKASGVIVDLCKDHGVWLDGGELARIARFLRERAAAGDSGAGGSGEGGGPARRPRTDAVPAMMLGPGRPSASLTGRVLSFLAEVLTSSLLR